MVYLPTSSEDIMQEVMFSYWLQHKRRQWPPEFPRRKGLLFSYENDPTTPREEWGANEWRAYASFLEESGASLLRELMHLERQLQKAQSSLSRRKHKPRTESDNGSMLTTGLLNVRVKKKPGRKPSSHREATAAEILDIRRELQAQGKRVTDRLALEEWFARNGKRRSRANDHRNLLNAVSAFRKKHNIPKR